MRKRKMAPSDLTVESLPHTRKELFFDILKLRWKLLIVLGMILALSILPSIIVFFLRSFSLQNLYSSYDWANISEEQLLEYEMICREQKNFWNLFQLPCFIIISISLAGFMRIIRQLNYSKGIHFQDDFKLGIKQNFLHFFIMAVIAFVIFYITSMISNMGVDNVFIRYLPVGVSIIIFVPLFFNMISLSVTYNLKFGKLIKNAIVLSLKNILWYLIFIVLFFAPIALFLIKYYFIIYIVYFLLIIIYYPILLLSNYLFNYASFDEYINKDNYKEIYRKGLY